MTIPLLAELQDLIDAVTPDDIRHAQASLPPVEDGETKVGVLHSDTTKALYVAMYGLLYSGAIKKITAAYKSAGKADAEILNGEGDRLKNLADLVSAIFWAQVKDDMRLFDADVTGVREDFMIVRGKDKPSLSSRLFGGLLKLPPPEED